MAGEAHSVVPMFQGKMDVSSRSAGTSVGAPVVAQSKVVNSLRFRCEEPQTVKIRSSRFLQGYEFVVDNCVRRKTVKRLRDLRESFVEVVVVSREKEKKKRTDWKSARLKDSRLRIRV